VPRIALPPVSPAILQLFEQEYRELRPRAPMPALEVKFRRFTSLNTTIRLRDGKLIVRLSDLLEHAPPNIHQAIAHILLAKLYRKPVAPVYADRYRRYTRSEAVSTQAERMRQMRGRKILSSPQGHLYDLDEVFESVNRRFFHGLLGRPTLTWSAHVRSACWDTMTPRTTRLSLAACLIGRERRGMPSSTCFITRCAPEASG